MSLHNSEVTQANYDALAVPVNLKKRKLPINMLQFLERTLFNKYTI